MIFFLIGIRGDNFLVFIKVYNLLILGIFMEEVGNVLRILREAKRFVEGDDAAGLKSLSNQTIHTAAVSQDGDNIVVAVLVYSLGKVMERGYYRQMAGWKEFYGAVVKNLGLAVVVLSPRDDSGEPDKEDIEKARVYLGRIRNSLNEIEGDLGRYVKDVFKKAEINKAFKLYEHGLSSEQTAKLLGVSLWDMASYIGQSHIGDAKVGVSMDIKKRVGIAEGMFG